MVPEASVIIPTYDEWHILQQCLDCLAGQSVALDRFEVIVANNNTSPEVPGTVRLPANARVIHVPKPGSYAARNAALREAQGKVLFFTDSDCRPDGRWIENGLASLAGLRPIDRIAGAIELFPKGETWTIPELYDRIRSMRQETYGEEGWCATANLVTTRAAFDLAGPFSEDSFTGGDHEWGARASAAGSLIVLSPATLIRHPARSDFAALAKKARRLAGDRHRKTLNSTWEPRSPFRQLFPSRSFLQRIALDSQLSEKEKLGLFWLQYRLSFVNFVEALRLRYLSGTPRRS